MNRNGKIARLPLGLRTELNERLQKGEDGPALLAWLNGLPETKNVVEAQFAGAAISPQNLSEWRLGGYREWELRQELLAHLDNVSQLDEEMEDAAGGNLMVEKLFKLVTARYAALLAGWDGEITAEFDAKMKVLGKLTRDIAILQRATQQGVQRRAEHREKEENRRIVRNRTLLQAPWLLANQGENWRKIKAEIKALKEEIGSTSEEEKIKPDQTSGPGGKETSNVQHSTSNVEKGTQSK